MKSIKKLIIAISLTTGAMVTSCQKLDMPPKNIFTSDVIFNSQAGIQSFLATIYQDLPIEDFKYNPSSNDGSASPAGFAHGGNDWMEFFNEAANTGEEVGPYGGMDIASGFGFWPYGDIRNVNIMIAELPKHTAELTPAGVDALLGEAHFLRAYYYFGLAKRYGGVPIITTVQDPGAPLATLQVHRDKEQAVWDFIGAELDLGYNMMPATSDAGRANKYVAAALKSRAMLYAACVAKYGSVNFVDGQAVTLGLAGIPAAAATGYFQAAYDAAKLLDGVYSLYAVNPDKEQNYVDLFLKPSPENIFIKQYSTANNTAHSWDDTMSPRYFTANALTRSYPTLDLVQLWGNLQITNPDGTPKRFDNYAQLMQGLEPRLRATIYFPGATLRGLTFDVQRGIYPSFSGTAADEVAKPANSRTYILGSDDNAQPYQGNQIVGHTGIWSKGTDEVTRTGFYVRKYIDYNKAKADVNLNTSTTPWIDLRYAEVLLNRAEAAVELGNTADALTSINLIRDRAGAGLYGSIDLTKVRNERRMELAFENQYYWDLKRWRTGDIVLDRSHFQGLMPYFVLNENKYIFLAEPELFNREYTFQKQFYYEPIPGGEIANNPNLLPNNPGF